MQTSTNYSLWLMRTATIVAVVFGEGKQVGAAIIDFRGSYEKYLLPQGLT